MDPCVPLAYIGLIGNKSLGLDLWRAPTHAAAKAMIKLAGHELTHSRKAAASLLHRLQWRINSH